MKVSENFGVLRFDVMIILKWVLEGQVKCWLDWIDSEKDLIAVHPIDNN
jgi:hypothetical protein